MRFRHAGLFVLAAGLLLAITGCGSGSSTGEEAGSASRPHIVVLFVDNMGYGDLSSYGSPQIRTPNLTRLERQGTRLTSFYAASWCVPSRYELMTGRYYQRAAMGGRTGANGEGGIRAEEVTLAERLSEAGYYTQMIGKWHLGHAEDRFLPHRNGFDDWYGLPYSNDYMPPWVQTDVPLNLYHNDEVVEHPVDQHTLTTRYTERAVELITSGEERPFFLYLPYNMPHMPIRTADRFRGQSDGGLYGDGIETIDWSVGRIMEALDQAGLADNTLLFFTSDNGPWLDLPPRMLQGEIERWHGGSPGPFRGYMHTSYEGGVRVPAIVRWPGKIPADRTATGIVNLMDVYTTLLAAAGSSAPEGRTVDGQNLLPYLRGRTEQARRVHFYEEGGGLEAVRSGPWKLRIPPEGEGPTWKLRLPPEGPPPVQLFHLGRDPSERWNVAEEHPELVDSLRTLLEEKEAEILASRE